MVTLKHLNIILAGLWMGEPASSSGLKELDLHSLKMCRWMGEPASSSSLKEFDSYSLDVSLWMVEPASSPSLKEVVLHSLKMFQCFWEVPVNPDGFYSRMWSDEILCLHCNVPSSDRNALQHVRLDLRQLLWGVCWGLCWSTSEFRSSMYFSNAFVGDLKLMARCSHVGR